MNQEKFIDIIKTTVEEATVEGLVSNLTNPPGSMPDPALLALSEWFNKLGTTDKEQVQKVIQEAVSSTIFGFLCVLDGVRSIREADDDFDPALKLTYIGAEEEVILNSPDEDYLHDIYNSL